MGKKKILLKITGNILANKEKKIATDNFIKIIEQIIVLKDSHQFGIVIGGGNIFRGNKNSESIGISSSKGHQIGMLSTMINGLIIEDLLTQYNLPAVHLSSLFFPNFITSFSPNNLAQALETDKTIVFSAGIGNPYFTTDTTAMLRGLQMDAFEIWKGTNVPGVFTEDPSLNPDAILLKKLNFDDALNQKLNIMDLTAFAFGKQYKQRLRIFDIYTKDALLIAAKDSEFGSLIY